MSIKELAGITYQELEKPCVNDVRSRLDDSVLAVFRKPVQGKGMGRRWMHTTANFEVTEQDLAGKRSPDRIVDILRRKRFDALLEMTVKIRDNCVERASFTSVGDLSKWRLVMLEGEWMETTVAEVGGKTVCYIDATYDYEPIPVEAAGESVAAKAGAE